MFRLNQNERLLKYCKYCIVGAIGRSADFSVYTILAKYFLVNYLVANICSLSVALILTYSIQKNWTFQFTTKDTKENAKTFQRYVASLVITFLLDNCVLIVLVSIFGYNVIISKVIQIGLGIIWGYCLTNFFVFNKNYLERSDKY